MTHRTATTTLALLAGLLAAPQVAAQVRANVCEEPNVLLVLDKSGSMEEADKWGQAGDAISAVVDRFAGRMRFGLMVFPLGDVCEVDWRNGALRAPIAPLNGAAIIDQIDRVRPNGGTPLERALDNASGYLRDLDDRARRNFIVLITDGQEDCPVNGDPIRGARNAHADGYDVFVVGFGRGVDRFTLNAMAEVGGTGRAYQVDDRDQLFEALDEIGRRAAQEVCDNLDNDCDGAVDEDLAMNRCDAGACGMGNEVCADGVPLCLPDQVPPEVCNGQDDDCDGAVDENTGICNGVDTGDPINVPGRGGDCDPTTGICRDGDGGGWRFPIPSPDGDDDRDGIPNGDDRDWRGFPTPPPPDPNGDDDGDGVPNGDDPDGDNDGDGIPNGRDPLPWFPFPDPNGDDDGDGVPNGDDPDGDNDGDGIPNGRDPWPHIPDPDPHGDEDGDGIPNWQDRDYNPFDVPGGSGPNDDDDRDGIPNRDDPDYTPFDEPGEEVCDGRDNDFDGVVDEYTDVVCEVGCHVGRRICTEGTLIRCTAIPVTEEEVTCDGIDDDCDGITDEDAPCGGEDICGEEGMCLRPCQANECPQHFVCLGDGYCHPKPCETPCNPGQACHNEVCVDPCIVDADCGQGRRCNGAQVCEARPEPRADSAGSGVFGPGGEIIFDDPPSPEAAAEAGCACDAGGDGGAPLGLAALLLLLGLRRRR
ncbi:MAG: vWA domain-containing protein [Planctomycetota bacterium]|jgi:MYXO-CTERM domain-containing protein